MVAPAGAGTDRMRRLAPDLVAAVDRHHADLVACLDPATAELSCRLVAAIIEDADEAILDWRERPGLTGEQRAALALTEQFVHSAQFVTDQQYEDLARFLDSRQILALTALISLTERSVRLGRFLDTLGVA